MQYRRKVLIHEDRADLEGLELYLHWYSPREVPQGQQQLVYEYTHTDTKPVDIATVICPCALVYTADDSTYTMQATTYEVIHFAHLISVLRVVCTYRSFRGLAEVRRSGFHPLQKWLLLPHPRTRTRTKTSRLIVYAIGRVE